jgi:predicted amidophosphoribosyltransferase
VELLASVLAGRHGIPVSHCLERSERAQQKTLDVKSRQENLRGSIWVRAGCRPPEEAVLLDDVLTTGATMNVCAAALRDRGTRRVFGLSLAVDE